MAISIDWPTGVISVPKADLTLVSGTLYTHDTDAFRLELKSLEATADGMGFPKTHNHNTEVTIAGVTYARTIEILAPYTVEYEDGQYSVRLEGSNNNIWDVGGGILAQNQVQVIPTNSAGLIVSAGGGGGPTAAQIADAVWDEAETGHTTAGTMGALLKKASKALKLGEFIGLK